MRLRRLIALTCACFLSACSPARAQAQWSTYALDDLEAVAAAAPLEGLPSEDASLAELESFRHMSELEPAADAQVDVAASALFRSLARSFANGGADPARADPDWAIPLSMAPDFDALEAARDAGAAPSALLYPLLPQSPEYIGLRAELARVKAEPHDTENRQARIVQLRASLERWRWLPRPLPPRRLDVRIPQFELVAISPDTPDAHHRVIVGARDNQTPSFVGQIGSITFNPSWEPPASIAAGLLARFRQNPAAAAREGFEGVDAQGFVHDAADINWRTQPFPYRLRQRPGPLNALGRIRFDMADAYAIRLHDTPDRRLFDRDVRALSHGCIRLQAPEDLAVRVLDTPAWTSDALETAIASGAQQTISLNETLPVYLYYITVSVDTNGAVTYANDIYHRDERVVEALDAPDVGLVGQNAAAPERCSVEPAMP